MQPVYVILSKAAPLCGREAPSLKVEATVDVSEELPSSRTDFDHRLFYESQARSLVQAFRKTLPGGLIDAIAVEMLRLQVSILSVPYPEKE
jgi:hypothetical protein